VSNLAGMSPVAVQVTNTDTAPHSLTIQADFLAGGQLIGVATGAVNGLDAGQTKTASLLMTGTAQGADQTLLAADTIVQ
jgi:hypothetical protein